MHSLLIHVKSCQKKWVKQNEQQPPGKRRPLPPPPPELADPGDPSSLASSTDALLLPSKPEDIDAFNARMFSYWDQVSLEGCPHCGRTFNQEALDKHKKVCSAQKPFKPLHKSSSEGYVGCPPALLILILRFVVLSSRS